MTSSTNNGENGTPGIGNDLFQYAPAATPAASRGKDASWAGLATTVVPVALGLMLGVAYLGYAHVQRQIKAQHVELQSLKDTQAELQSLKDKIQGVAAAAQSRTDVEQSQPSINELQGLLNHVDILRVQAKQRHPKQQKQ
jgi:hypothetical protein